MLVTVNAALDHLLQKECHQRRAQLAAKNPSTPLEIEPSKLLQAS